MSNGKAKYTYIALAISAALTSSLAQAQQEDEFKGIEKIVVTAQKRVQSLQEVPASISAFGANEMKENQMVKIDDVISATPNLSFTPFSEADPQLSIRGISSTADGVGGDPSVVVFINDIAINRAGGANLDIYDLERVEVMRGPQGTLYGKNAVGGAINFITKAPEEFFSAEVSATLGDYNLRELKGHVNFAIASDTAVRISGLTKDRDGFQKNLVTGKDVDDANTKSIRGQISHSFDNGLDVLVSTEYTKNDTAAGSRVPFPIGTFVTDGYDDAGLVPNDNPREVEPNTDGYFKRDVSNSFVKITKELDIGTVTSLTSYRHTKFDWLQDLVGLPISVVQLKTVNLATEKDKQFTQELRINGLSMADKLNWVAGVYYSTEDVDRTESYDRTYRFLSTQQPLPGKSLVSFPEFDQFATIESKAVFAQGTYAFTDKLNVTIGGRYTVDDKDIDLAINDLLAGKTPGPDEIFTLAPADEVYAITASDSWSSFTPKIAVDYQLTADAMIYTSASKGYKAGGFQSAPSNKISAEQSFDPEEVINYEIGAKTQWFNNKVRLNSNLFYMDYSNLQFFELVGTGADSLLVVQSTNAEIKGLELEMLVRPTQDLQLGFNYALLDTELGAYINAAGKDFTGNKLSRSPESSYSLSAQYWLDLAGKGTMSFRTAYEYTGDQFFDANNDPVVGGESGYGLLNASVRYESTSGDWNVTAWAKNLTDELYRSTSITAADTGFARIGNPRTVGVTFNMYFE
ncbi:TonB-dependent receptor [Rheinheimera salexigens]|uniref:TonB-dependent receptor n=1 Tax=Rheinheimera salexigens TaxID=1628148 RepID=A0A1E7Q3D1_9GAMM|nr:TonB-dependent receptor [Rheinheimera salexigens]OEY68649.1 hypothetical protein BI198_02970 [Rheinheimera salexigens]